MSISQKVLAAGEWGRYAESDRTVEIVYFYSRLGKQKWLASLLSSERLLAIAP
ncbi:MAG: hypothetical protein LH649_14450 [Pseudanabaena sp. CAN_BIN31]|nr:hypothetical protein [Pseudanabaena sp. CAN_BIN31]